MDAVVIGEEDSYLIMISAIWPDTSYYLLGQYYLEAMSPIDLVLSDFEALS